MKQRPQNLQPQSNSKAHAANGADVSKSRRTSSECRAFINRSNEELFAFQESFLDAFWEQVRVQAPRLNQRERLVAQVEMEVALASVLSLYQSELPPQASPDWPRLLGAVFGVCHASRLRRKTFLDGKRVKSL